MARKLNTAALYACLDSKREAEGLTWTELAAELELTEAGVFSRLFHGKPPAIDTLIALTEWLGYTIEDFIGSEELSEEEREEIVERMRRYLEQDGIDLVSLIAGREP